MFIEKYKVHPIDDEDSDLAEIFEDKQQAEEKCKKLNESKTKNTEWVITSFMENQGF